MVFIVVLLNTENKQKNGKFNCDMGGYMKNNANKIDIKQYITQDEQISSLIRKTVYKAPIGKGEVFSLKLYPGVEIWTFDLDVTGMNFSALENKRSLMLNYCFSGRYEMQLPDNRYIYASSGTLCIDKTPPFGRTIVSIGKYTGIEISVNLDLMGQHPSTAWMECGIDLNFLENSLKQTGGSHFAKVTTDYDHMIRILGKHINLADWEIEKYRFYVLCLLWKLQNENCDNIPYNPVFLTTGQRAVVTRICDLLTQDLSKRYIINNLAKTEGISAASIKKYFALVYGKPISAYLKEKRVEKAKKLLIQSKLSIGEIAGSVGYNNQSKFAAMFREKTSVTPTEYRRLYNNKDIINTKEDY